MLEDNYIIIFGGGIGNPFVSTDYPAVQKSIEIEADMLFMAKNIDGVYDSDPHHNKNAIFNIIEGNNIGTVIKKKCTDVFY